MSHATKPSLGRLHQHDPDLLAWFLVDTPRGSYPGDTPGDVADITRRNPAGVRHGGCSYANGPSGAALALDGTDGYVDCGVISVTGALTISAWIEPATLEDGMVVSNYASSGVVVQYDFATQPDGSLYFAVQSSAAHGSTWQTAAGAYAAGVRQNVAITHDGTLASGGVQFYVDGKPVAATYTPLASGPAASIPASAGNAAIGRTGDFSGEYSSGLIDNVKILGRAWTSAEAAREFADPYRMLRRRVTAATLATPPYVQLPGGGFESPPAVGANGMISPPGTPWTWGTVGNSGQAFKNCNLLAFPNYPPEGNQSAFMQFAGASFSQDFLSLTDNYTFKFDYATAAPYSPNAAIMTLSIDGTVIGTVTPDISGAWTVDATFGPVALTAGVHTLTFTMVNNAYGVIDDVRISPKIPAYVTTAATVPESGETVMVQWYHVVGGAVANVSSDTFVMPTVSINGGAAFSPRDHVTDPLDPWWWVQLNLPPDKTVSPGDVVTLASAPPGWIQVEGLDAPAISNLAVVNKSGQSVFPLDPLANPRTMQVGLNIGYADYFGPCPQFHNLLMHAGDNNFKDGGFSGGRDATGNFISVTGANVYTTIAGPQPDYVHAGNIPAYLDHGTLRFVYRGAQGSMAIRGANGALYPTPPTALGTDANGNQVDLYPFDVRGSQYSPDIILAWIHDLGDAIPLSLTIDELPASSVTGRFHQGIVDKLKCGKGFIRTLDFLGGVNVSNISKIEDYPTESVQHGVLRTTLISGKYHTLVNGNYGDEQIVITHLNDYTNGTFANLFSDPFPTLATCSHNLNVGEFYIVYFPSRPVPAPAISFSGGHTFSPADYTFPVYVVDATSVAFGLPISANDAPGQVVSDQPYSCTPTATVNSVFGGSAPLQASIDLQKETGLGLHVPIPVKLGANLTECRRLGDYYAANTTPGLPFLPEYVNEPWNDAFGANSRLYYSYGMIDSTADHTLSAGDRTNLPLQWHTKQQHLVYQTFVDAWVAAGRNPSEVLEFYNCGTATSAVTTYLSAAIYTTPEARAAAKIYFGYSEYWFSGGTAVLPTNFAVWDALTDGQYNDLCSFYLLNRWQNGFAAIRKVIEDAGFVCHFYGYEVNTQDGTHGTTLTDPTARSLAMNTAAQHWLWNRLSVHQFSWRLHLLNVAGFEYINLFELGAVWPVLWPLCNGAAQAVGYQAPGADLDDLPNLKSQMLQLAKDWNAGASPPRRFPWHLLSFIHDVGMQQC